MGAGGLREGEDWMVEMEIEERVPGRRIDGAGDGDRYEDGDKERYEDGDGDRYEDGDGVEVGGEGGLVGWRGSRMVEGGVSRS